MTESTPRHQWMCDQLRDRRSRQFGLQSLLSTTAGASRAALNWYQTQLGAPGIIEVVEVLSDGLGYIEPNWHAARVNEGEATGFQVLTRAQLFSYQHEIRQLRAKLGGGVHLRTQRAIGEHLYEQAVFLVSKSGTHLLSAGEWRAIDRDTAVPLITPGAEKEGTRARPDNLEIAEALKTVTTEVLWKAFLSLKAPTTFSLVLLQTSLYHRGAGVWALHVASDKEFDPTKNKPTLTQLENLLVPPVRCLDDVLGWSNEVEGLHRWRERNVDFLYACCGRTPPEWTADGLHYAEGDGLEDRGLDSTVYCLPVEAEPSATIRQVFRLAVTRQSDLQDQQLSIHPRNDRSIQSVEALVVGLRLLETHSYRPKGLTTLGDSASLYLEKASELIGLAWDGNQNPVQFAQNAIQELQERAATDSDATLRVVTNCLADYLAWSNSRALLAWEGQGELR